MVGLGQLPEMHTGTAWPAAAPAACKSGTSNVASVCCSLDTYACKPSRHTHDISHGTLKAADVSTFYFVISYMLLCTVAVHIREVQKDKVQLMQRYYNLFRTTHAVNLVG